MADLDRLLRPDIADRAAEQAHAPSFEAIEHRGVQWRRRHTSLVAGALATALVLAVVALSQVLPGRPDAAPTYPVEHPNAAWTPIRAPREAVDDQSVVDPTDAANKIIDIRRLEVGEFGGPQTQNDFRIEIADSYNGESPVGQAIEYGVVIDTDGDLKPDCHLGISNPNDPAAQPQGLHVWLRNLRTGGVDDGVGGPYGDPFDFAFDKGGPASAVKFFFLTDKPEPCEDYGPGAHFYAYSSLTENGQVTAWDFAPDRAWIRLR